MRLKRVAFLLGTCLLIVSLDVARGNDNRRQFGPARVIALPTNVVVDEYCAPLISSSGDVAFFSSVMSGALIALSVTSGKILSSVTDGEIAGIVSMVETDNRRLIALPTANDPDNGRPATVAIINASVPDRLAVVALIVLPGDVHLTPATRALLTADGRFGVIATSLKKPTLVSFSVETGKITSMMSLPGWPSDIALHDGRKDATDSLVAVVSVEANLLSLIRLDRLGRLTAGKTFSPHGMRFDVSNNPAFSTDGQIVYVAVYDGEHVFSIDTQKGTVLGMIKLASAPQRITVVRDQTGTDLIGTTRAGQTAATKPSGVTLLASNRGQLTVKAEFNAPTSVKLSRANNIVFDSAASVALVGSSNGTLFVLYTKTGEMESYKITQSEVRGLALNDSSRTLIGMCSTPKRDEIVIVDFDQDDPGASNKVTSRNVPAINKVSIDTIQLRITIAGTNFTKGATVEFVKAGDVVFREHPVILSNRQLAITIPIKKIEALGTFKLRVVTPDKVASNLVTIEPPSLRTGIAVDSIAFETNKLRPTGSGEATAARTKTSPSKLAESTAAKTKTSPSKVTESTVAKTPTPPSKSAESTATKTTTSPSLRPATVVRSVRMLPGNGTLRILVEADGEVKFTDFTLGNPTRIVVDVADVRNGFGNKTLKVSSGMIERVRVGQPRPGVVRVVLDTNGTVGYGVMRENNSLIIDVGGSTPRPSAKVLRVQH
jgi:hypothetical protein